jgi:hypothetical protein
MVQNSRSNFFEIDLINQVITGGSIIHEIFKVFSAADTSILPPASGCVCQLATTCGSLLRSAAPPHTHPRSLFFDLVASIECCKCAQQTVLKVRPKSSFDFDSIVFSKVNSEALGLSGG